MTVRSRNARAPACATHLHDRGMAGAWQGHDMKSLGSDAPMRAKAS